MSPWLLYLIIVSSSLKITLSILASIGSAILLVVTVIRWVEWGESRGEKPKIPKGWIGTFIAVFILTAFLPTTPQLAAIVGISYVTQVDEVGNLPPKAIKALNTLLDKYIESSEVE